MSLLEVDHMKTEASENKLLFISDVHLGGFSRSENKLIEKRLIRFIDFCENNDYKIHILGDLFDYWMEYPNYKPGVGENLLERFHAYNYRTGPTLYITGNHDNWTNGYFKTLGFEVERNHRFLQVNGKKVMLLHGDGLENPTFDLQRPLFHRLLRDSRFIKLYQTVLPPAAGIKVMKNFSRLARAREVSETEKNLNNWAQNELERRETDLIICGHDHTPRMLRFSFGTFINLGTFYEHQTVATYNNREFSLVVWDDATGNLKPFTAPD